MIIGDPKHESKSHKDTKFLEEQDSDPVEIKKVFLLKKEDFVQESGKLVPLSKNSKKINKKENKIENKKDKKEKGR